VLVINILEEEEEGEGTEKEDTEEDDTEGGVHGSPLPEARRG
jgi:hypothetical protein